MTEIKGSINYTLTSKADGGWDIKYDQKIDNDLAVLAISKVIMEECEKHYEDDLIKAEGKFKQSLKARLPKIRAAVFGLQLQVEFLLNVFDEYKTFVENNKDKTDKAPSITLEQKAELDQMVKDIKSQVGDKKQEL